MTSTASFDPLVGQAEPGSSGMPLPWPMTTCLTPAPSPTQE
jgi:hypothetical protein